MRARQPLLHHQYVGQYQPAEPRAPRERDSHPLSGSILTDLDEAATRERFDREREAQDAVESGGLQCAVSCPADSWLQAVCSHNLQAHCKPRPTACSWAASRAEL